MLEVQRTLNTDLEQKRPVSIYHISIFKTKS